MRTCKVTGAPAALGRPEAVIAPIAIGGIPLRHLARNHRAHQSLRQSPLQLGDGPVDVVHRDHADSDEPLGIMRYKLGFPVIEDLGTGL